MILVNGASGTLGQRVVVSAVHLHGGQNVLRGYRAHRPDMSQCRLIDGNRLVDQKQLHEIDIIINCAGAVKGNDDSIWQANVTHPVDLAKKAKEMGARKFVQVSSFSVYGDVENIDTETPIAPQTHYGRSKAEAELQLQKLHGDGFSTISVRLPFLFDANHPALMRGLIRLMRLLPVLPVAAHETRRSMITYPAAASALLHAAGSDLAGPACAADPEPFRFALLAQVMRDAGLRPAILVPVPLWVERALDRLAPAVSRRLMRSCLLDNGINIMPDPPKLHGLEAEMRQVLRVL